MTTLTFPLAMNLDEIAALPGAADAFGWDSSSSYDETLPEHIAYCLSGGQSDVMKTFFALHGFNYDETGFTARDADSIRKAALLFELVCFEYDEYPLSDEREALRTRLGHTSPVWFLLGLGGDDDVDYCGTQPSCLTDLLLPLLPEA